MASVDEDDEGGSASKQTAKVLNHLVRSAATAKTRVGSGAVDDDVVDTYGAPSSTSSPSLSPSKELYFRFSTLSSDNQQSFSCVHGESVIYYRLLKAYLSSNLLLSLLPLALGAAIGFYFGDKRRTKSKKALSSFIMRVPQTFLRLCLHLMIRGQDSKLNAIENKTRESGVDLECVPRHVAVIMDGNRRYGKEKYGNSTRGHIEGSKKLFKFTQWCLDEGIEILTVYAFSTENWNRPAEEVSALMSIFWKYCNEFRPWAIENGIRIHVLATESERIPENMRIAIKQMEVETRHCNKLTMNICLSYGGRNEIVNACKSVAIDLQEGKLNVNQIAETVLQGKMLTSHCCDPEVIIRTSGEERLSNFLLWQAAYSEFFFLKKPWPAMEKDDLLDVIREFANGRKRRFGK